MAARWYIVSFHKGRENAARMNLTNQGFEIWMPRELRVVTHARSRTEKLVPFFPGHMFVEVDLELQRWRAINSTIGMHSLIMQGDSPLPCPIGLVETMQAFARKNECVYFDTIPDGVDVDSPAVRLVRSLGQVNGRERFYRLLELCSSPKEFRTDR